MIEHLLEFSLTFLGILLVAMGGDYYRRLWQLRCQVKDLEDKMVSLDFASQLHGQDVGYVKQQVSNTAQDIAAIKRDLVPSLNRLSTQVALIADRLQLHIDSMNKENE